MKDKQHTESIPSDVLSQVQTKIQEIQTLLAPESRQFRIKRDYFGSRGNYWGFGLDYFYLEGITGVRGGVNSIRRGIIEA
jgi:hypothetical protein